MQFACFFRDQKRGQARHTGVMLRSGKHRQFRLKLLRCDIASQQLQLSVFSLTHLLFFSLFLLLSFIIWDLIDVRTFGPNLDELCNYEAEIVRQRFLGCSATGNEQAFLNDALTVVHEHMQKGFWPTIFVHGRPKKVR